MLHTRPLPINFENIDSKAACEKHLVDLFTGTHWPTSRRWLIRKVDENPFITANILFELQQNDIQTETLKACIEPAKAYIRSFIRNGLTYHWPIQNGRAAMPNSRLQNIPAFDIDPDADCSALSALVLGDPTITQKTIAALSEHRFGARHKPYPFQSVRLGDLSDIFTVWFPKSKTLYEQFDAVVLSNVLLFLKQSGQDTIQGYSKSRRKLIDLLEVDLQSHAYDCSVYYPSARLILYFINRYQRADPFSPEGQQRIQELNESLPINNRLDVILHTAISNEHRKPLAFHTIDPAGAVYVWPVLSGPNGLHRLSRRRMFQVKFESPAFELAVLHRLMS